MGLFADNLSNGARIVLNGYTAAFNSVPNLYTAVKATLNGYTAYLTMELAANYHGGPFLLQDPFLAEKGNITG